MTGFALVAALLLAGAQQEGPTPTRRELTAALMPIDFCAGEDSGACDSGAMPRKVRVRAARCVAEAPRDGKPVALCRATFTWVHYVRRLDHTYRGLCVRLIRYPSSVAGAAPYWSWDPNGAKQPDCEARDI